MQCKDFEAVLEQEGLAPLPLAAKSHLAQCSTCQNLFADLSVLVSAAQQLPAEMNPPQRLWVSLRAQMEREGLIKQPRAVAEEKALWWQALKTLFKPRVLVTAGAGLALAFAAFLTVHRSLTGVTKTPAPSVGQVSPPVQPNEVRPSSSGSPIPVPDPAPQPIVSVKPRANPKPPAIQHFKPSPSDNVYASFPVALQDPEQNVNGPSLRGSVEADASLRENLRVINAVIAECEKHLKKYPNDTMAREYLASANRQKAELVATILDSGRSEQ
jgi:hypothetical protein